MIIIIIVYSLNIIVAGMAVSSDASLLASISLDRSVKVFDVRTLDMMAMLRLPFVPACVEWIFKVLSKFIVLPIQYWAKCVYFV